MDTSANLPSIAQRTETVLSQKGGLELKGTVVVGARVIPLQAEDLHSLKQVAQKSTTKLRVKSVCRKEDGADRPKEARSMDNGEEKERQTWVFDFPITGP